MIEDEHVIGKFENKKLEINFKLFSIAIKNGVDIKLQTIIKMIKANQ